MKFKFTGAAPVELPTLGLYVEPGDTIDAPADTKLGDNFTPAKPKTTGRKAAPEGDD